MTKKSLLVIALAISVLSIILIAVWGTLPDSPSNIQADSLVIEEFEETNDDGDKFINVTDVVTETKTVYVIEYTINPHNANVDVIASTTSQGVNLTVDASGSRVYVLYSLEAITEKQSVTVQIKDKNTQIYDEVTLWFETPGVIVVPNI